MNIRIIAPVGLSILLGGCAMSSGMALMTYTATGISYASSGKGVADHALSAAAAKDCVMLRVIQGKDICARDRTGEDGTLMTMIDTSSVPPDTSLSKPPGRIVSVATMQPKGSGGPTPAAVNGAAVSALELIYGHKR